MAHSNGGLFVILLLIIAVVVWGLIGSSEADKIGTTCDFGVGKNSLTGETGSTFCWKWHRNELGQLGDNLQDLLGSSGK
jgi:hypothetical protein